MYLKALEIQGFKSFPERTVVEFHKGMTAIVGPNGSGKSNVTDAVRWVLGEQSVKALRGRKMEDVIFAGTEHRRPLGFAEVTLIFDNTEGLLPLDYREVSITRRLYRTGESEYKCNQTPCRLKDIHQLFLDTGVGRDGYSIVGQGRVEELLSARSEDRRRVFEEAAGIAKLRSQKDETEKHLKQTEENLEQVQLILNELEKRVAPLEEQSRKAQKYLQVQEDLSLHEKSLFHRLLSTQEQQLNELKEQYEQSSAYLAEAEHAEEAGQEAYDQVIRSLNELEVSDQNLQIALQEEQREELYWAQVQVRQEEELRSIAQQQESLENNQSEGNVQIELDRIELEKKRLEAEQQEGRLKEALQIAESQTEALQRAQELFLLGERQLAEYRLKIQNLNDQVYENKLHISENQLLLEQICAGEEENKLQLDEHKQLLNQQDQELAHLEDQKKEIQELLQNLNEQIQEARGDWKEADELVQKQEVSLQSLQERRNQLQYQVETLSALEANYEGYAAPIQALLTSQNLPRHLRQGIYGTVAELIHVPQQYELAVEVALGNTLQNIVTDEDRTATECIRFLKKEQIGRATFLPLAQLQIKELKPDLLRKAEEMNGYLGVLADFVEPDDSLRDRQLIENLLGTVLLAQSQEEARLIAQNTKHRVKIVTLEGEIFSPGGAITGGGLRRRKSNLLGRNRELAEARKDLEKLPQLLEEAQKILKQGKAEQEQCQADLKVLEEEQQNLLQRKLKIEIQSEELQKKQIQLLLQLEKYSQVQKRHEEKKKAVMLALQKEEEESQKLDQERKSWEEELGRSSSGQNASQKELDLLKQKQLEAAFLSQQEEEKLKNLQTWIARLDSDYRSKQMAWEARAEKGLELQKRYAELEKALSQTQKTRSDWAKKHEEARICSQKNQEIRKNLEAQREQRKKEQEEVAACLAKIRQECDRLLLRREQVEAREEELRQRLWEDYNCVFEQLEETQLLSSEEPLAELKKKTERFKQQIRNLGPVHLDAIQEYEEVSTRKQFLEEQIQDIRLAQTQLKGILSEVIQTMKTRFSESFEQINQNFNHIFHELFGGGRAQVWLSEADQLLDSQIEIQASPPGKKLQSMLLLSGGERALTAIALLFAILSLRAAPFVILDEIEAALDDANVLRFTDYIREHSKASQFILVTHRKGTMEACSRIYGVTMQERGVSKILSMKLQENTEVELKDEGEI